MQQTQQSLSQQRSNSGIIDYGERRSCMEAVSQANPVGTYANHTHVHLHLLVDHSLTLLYRLDTFRKTRDETHILIQVTFHYFSWHRLKMSRRTSRHGLQIKLATNALLSRLLFKTPPGTGSAVPIPTHNPHMSIVYCILHHTQKPLHQSTHR